MERGTLGTRTHGSRDTIAVVKVVCAVLFLLTIIGLIASSIAGNNEGWVISIGLLGTSAAVVLIVVSLVSSQQRLSSFSEANAEDIERRIQELVAAGADEASVRSLVRSSIRMGRGL